MGESEQRRRANQKEKERAELLESMKYCPVCAGELKKLHGSSSSEYKTCESNHGLISVSTRVVDGVNFRVHFEKTAGYVKL